MHWPIFVLTLSGDDERRAPLLQALRTANLPYELFFGVDGRDGLPPQYLNIIDRNTSEKTAGRPLSDAEYACALSHRKAYEYIISHSLDGAVILEDDAILGEEFQRFITDKAYIKAPMILFYHSFARIVRGNTRDISPYGTLGRIASRPSGAVAYSIDRTVAQRLLSATTPIRGNADWPIDLYTLGAWALCPKIVEHPEQTIMQSRIEERRRELQKQPRRKSIRRLFTRTYWRSRFSVPFCR